MDRNLDLLDEVYVKTPLSWIPWFRKQGVISTILHGRPARDEKTEFGVWYGYYPEDKLVLVKKRSREINTQDKVIVKSIFNFIPFCKKEGVVTAISYSSKHYTIYSVSRTLFDKPFGHYTINKLQVVK
jgi:hypothetical protein